MAEIWTGVFALGGAAIATAAQWALAERTRRYAVEDRAHAEEVAREARAYAARREDKVRWVEARRDAHASFLAACGTWQDTLRAVVLHHRFDISLPSDAELDNQQTVTEATAAELQLIAGDAARECAQDWIQALQAAEVSRLLNNYSTSDTIDYLDRVDKHLTAASAAQKRYVAAARMELGTAEPSTA